MGLKARRWTLRKAWPMHIVSLQLPIWPKAGPPGIYNGAFSASWLPPRAQRVMVIGYDWHSFRVGTLGANGTKDPCDVAAVLTPTDRYWIHWGLLRMAL